MKQALVATMSLFSLAGVAMAADLPSKKAAAPATPPPAVATWTGFYIGAVGGYAWNTGGYGVSVGGAPGGISTPTQNVIARSLRGGSSGVTFGGEAGYNVQMDPSWVGGVEGDLSYANLGVSSRKVGVALFGAPNPPKLVTTTGSDSLNWMGSLRGRVGYLPTSTILVFATGGLAVGGPSAKLGVATSGGFSPADTYSMVASSSGARLGWIAGAGVEVIVAPNWSVKAEYLHYDLGSPSLSLARPNATPPGFTAVGAPGFKGDIVRVGVNWKFAAS